MTLLADSEEADQTARIRAFAVRMCKYRTRFHIARSILEAPNKKADPACAHRSFISPIKLNEVLFV